MRYIGNKENIIEKIYGILQHHNVEGDSFFDFFSGTTNVARFYKNKGYQVYTSDILYLSYCLQKAYIENNNEPCFEKLLSTIEPYCSTLFSTPLQRVLCYLDSIEGVQGFIYHNYTPAGTRELPQPRLYFSDENGKRIDAIRQRIEQWYQSELIDENEYYVLLSCLIESVSFYANIAGVYAAFQKKWDPRALKTLKLRPIRIYDNNKNNKAYCSDSLTLISEIQADIVYLDPPYNNRQYLPNYHVLETIAKYDNPVIHGVTGMRDYDIEKSSFCSEKTALRDLEYIASKVKCRYLVLSYNSEGIMSSEDIMSILSKYGTVEVEQFEYTRFKSNNLGLSKTKKHVYEQVYILYRDEDTMY